MKIVFLGSPEAALPTVEALAASSHQIVAVISQPDRPAGRGRHLHPCSVAAFARKHKLSLYQPVRAKDAAFVKTFEGWQADLAIVVAYGQILPRAIVAAPRFGCWNIHFSLLPRYRGAAPVAWALINGETQTGVTLMRLVEKLDAGPILKQVAEPIRPDDTTASLEARLARRGAELCLAGLRDLAALRPGTGGPLSETPQSEALASYAPMLKKEDGKIDWSETAATIARLVRGLNPWPGAYSYLPASGGCVDKTLLKIYSAEAGGMDTPVPAGTIVTADPASGWVIACGQGTLVVHEVQVAGKKRMTAAEFLRGHPIPSGAKLSS